MYDTAECGRTALEHTAKNEQKLRHITTIFVRVHSIWQSS